jgi:hypothetical protein
MGKLLALSLVCTLAAAVLFQPILMGKPRKAHQKSDHPDHAKGEFNDAFQALALGGIYRRLVFDVRPIGHA